VEQNALQACRKLRFGVFQKHSSAWKLIGEVLRAVKRGMDAGSRSNFQGNGAARTATLCRVLLCAWPQVHDGRYWVVWWLESRVDVSSLGFPATNDRLCGDGIPPSRRQVACGGHDLARV
jgi:hypothetical protein